MALKKRFLTGIEDTDGAPSSTTFETPADQSGDLQPGSCSSSASVEGDCLNHLAGPSSSSDSSEDLQSDSHGSQGVISSSGSVHSGSFLATTLCDIGNFVGKQLDDHAKWQESSPGLHFSILGAREKRQRREVICELLVFQKI